MPARIQRKRTKGWRIPEGAVCVSRPGIFGNPLWDVKRYGVELCVEMFREFCTGIYDPTEVRKIIRHCRPDVNEAMVEMWAKWMYDARHEWLREKIGTHCPEELIRRELRGKDLACWCPLDQSCHADVLLEIANGGE